MKLEEIRQAYEELSGTASKVSRQLALAGIGLVWIFKISDGGKTIIPNGLIWPSILLVASLALDVIQYFSQSTIWFIYYCYNRIKKKKEESDQIKEPEWPNYIMWFIFSLKIILMISAYSVLFYYLSSLLFCNTSPTYCFVF